jgi:hypothetical protein
VPLTLAHPAAAVPLAKPLERWGVLAALITGSIAPDLVYFLPFPITRGMSHSLGGLFWFCLPAGTALYALFHSALKGPLCALMPAGMQARFLRFLEPGAAHATRLLAIPVSVLAGAVSHLAWDSFTHPEAPAVAAFPILQFRLFTVSDYEVCVYNILQHLSTALGILLLVRWTARWYARAEVRPVRPALPGSARAWIVAGIVAGATVAALVDARPFLPARVTLHELQPFAWHAATTGLASIGAGILLYSVAFHAWRRRGGSGH